MIGLGEDVRKFPFDEMKSKKIDEIIDLEKLLTLEYNQRTEWGNWVQSPVSPETLLELGKNPGLGIRQLHEQGITGKGVNVAIIDQPLFGKHPEYQNNLVFYENSTASDHSMHGPAVVSILVGNNLGVAPDAKVFYVVAPSWDGDTLYEVKALETIIRKNKELPPDKKIRVVSVSAAPSSLYHRTKNQHLWQPMVKEAMKNNILVLDCSQENYLFDMCGYDLFDPDNLDKLTPRVEKQEIEGTIFLPCNNRSIAEVYNDGVYSYSHSNIGGLSWGIPYLSGLLALGWQVNPQLDPTTMMNLVLESCFQKDGLNYLWPAAFIKKVESYNK